MDQRWYETFFDERYLAFYPVLRDKPLAEEEARFVVDVLDLEPGQSVLDIGCGTGRHSVALARLGMQVTGLDLSPQLLEQARTTAESCGVQVTWCQRDMRDLDDLGPFDACISMYTAFGFFGDTEDQEVLYQAAAALRPGGALLLDLTNHLGYLRRFPRQVWHETEDAVLKESHTYEPMSGILITRRTCYWKEGGTMELPISRVRAYLPHEVRIMLERAGLRVIQVLGALKEVPFNWEDSPNQVYICRR